MGRRLLSVAAAIAAGVVVMAGCGSDDESTTSAARRAGVELDENHQEIADGLASSRSCDELTTYATAINQVLSDTAGDESIPADERATWEFIEDIAFERLDELGCEPVFRQVGGYIE